MAGDRSVETISDTYALSQSLRHQIEQHNQQDRAQSYLGRIFAALYRSDEASLKLLEESQQELEAAKQAGDRELLRKAEERAAERIKIDQQRISTQQEITGYGSGFVKTAALFMQGRLGLVGMVAASALDQARPYDSVADQLTDIGLGAGKGALIKGTFHVIGKQGLGVAATGVSLGVSSRLIETAIDRRAYVNAATGTTDFPYGLNNVLRQSLSSQALLSDVVIFGAAHGLLKGANQLSGEAIKRSPFLTTALTGTTFGLSSGAAAEIMHQQQQGEGYDLAKIARRAFIQGALDTLAAAPGGLQADHAFKARLSTASSDAVHRVKSQLESASADAGAALADLSRMLFAPTLPPYAFAIAGEATTIRPTIERAARDNVLMMVSEENLNARRTTSAKPGQAIEKTLADRSEVVRKAELIVEKPPSMEEATALNARLSAFKQALQKRTLTAAELKEYSLLSETARRHILRLEEQANQTSLGGDTARVLKDLSYVQRLLMDDIGAFLLPEIVEKRSAEPLSFQQAARERQLTAEAGRMLEFFDALARVRGKRGLTEEEVEIKAALSEQVEARRRLENEIEAALGSGPLARARHRLIAFQELTLDREANKGDLTGAELAQNTADLALTRARIDELSTLPALDKTQRTELTELEGLYRQGIEGRFRKFVSWAPDEMDRTHALLPPKHWKNSGLWTGQDAETGALMTLHEVLNEKSYMPAAPDQVSARVAKNLGVPQAELTSPATSALLKRYLSPENWLGTPTANGSAADHSKADYILFNKRTGHYFPLDITANVEPVSRNILFQSVVDSGHNVLLANKKADVAPERRGLIVAVSPDADWTQMQVKTEAEAAAQRFMDTQAPLRFRARVKRSVAQLLGDIITNERPLNILTEPFPSSDPALPREEKTRQLYEFERRLKALGFHNWAHEVGAARRWIRDYS